MPYTITAAAAVTGIAAQELRERLHAAEAFFGAPLSTERYVTYVHEYVIAHASEYSGSDSRAMHTRSMQMSTLCMATG